MSGVANKSGFITTNDGLKYYVTVPCNKPYCHFCRKQVPQVSVLDRLQGNPLHICKECLSARLDGFEFLAT
jgi:hypothetical protein